MKGWRKQALVLIGVAVVIYVGSYFYFSVQGTYGLEYPGSLMDGPVVGWQPKVLHSDKVWYQWIL